MTRFLIVLFSFLFYLQTSFANNKAPKSPAEVTVGAYITHIYDINLQKKTVSAIFWLWFIYPDQLIIDNNEFDIINAEKFSVLYKNTQQLVDNKTLKQYKIRATLSQGWSFENFPFSTKPLSIIIEDADFNAHTVIFKTDEVNSDVDHEMPLSGWTLSTDNWQTYIHHYDTNFGNPNNSGNTAYARAIYSVEMTHTNIRMFIHIFGMLYLACILILGMFFIPIKDIKSRLALNSAAIFAVVGSKISTDSILPPANTINLIDKIQLTVLIFMVITLITVVLNYYLCEKHIKWAHIVNVGFAILTVLMIALSNVFFMLA
ncbi:MULTISPECIES: hypothetical protein [Cysteiniphilum]|uniref:hypothetical protein n=1 Tax=Cysteiniphilum TaxID=2056696 RepID=UPI00177DACCC|nr:MULTISPECIES: hypothetical protein [Cysteiniphilum]